MGISIEELDEAFAYYDILPVQNSGSGSCKTFFSHLFMDTKKEVCSVRNGIKSCDLTANCRIGKLYSRMLKYREYCLKFS